MRPDRELDACFRGCPLSRKLARSFSPTFQSARQKLAGWSRHEKSHPRPAGRSTDQRNPAQMEPTAELAPRQLAGWRSNSRKMPRRKTAAIAGAFSYDIA